MQYPLISVVMPSYNHAPFVKEAMLSVLSQEGVHFEFLISDDGSSDGTRDVIESVRDPRIRYFPNQANRGACTVTNELITRSNGKYIALINSDDAWLPGKLQHQVEFLEKNPSCGATFGRARFVNYSSSAIATGDVPSGEVFQQPNRNAGQWLRRFFAEGNCLCHPTMLIRKSVYETVGLYSNRLRQLPDLDMWIRVVKLFEVHVSERDLINFRILPGENASSQTAKNSVRTLNEHYLIAESIFDGVTRERLIEGFGDILAITDIPSVLHLDIEKALLYFHDNQWLGRAYKMIGLLKMHELLNSESHRGILAADYGVGDHWFHDQMGKVDVLRSLSNQPEGLRSVVGGVIRNAWRRVGSF